MEYYNYTEDIEIDIDCPGEQKLCIACIIQAVKDIHYRCHSGYTYSAQTRSRIKEQAIRWFKSDSKEPFSFLWCLEHAFPDLFDTINIDYIIQTCLKKPLRCKRDIGLLPNSHSSSLYIKQ